MNTCACAPPVPALATVPITPSANLTTTAQGGGAMAAPGVLGGGGGSAAATAGTSLLGTTAPAAPLATTAAPMSAGAVNGRAIVNDGRGQFGTQGSGDNVVRDRATLARIVDGGQIENVYRIQVMNTTEREQHYSLSAQGLPQLQMHGEVSATLKPAEARWLVVQLRMPYGAEKKSGSHKVEVLTTNDAGQTVREKAVFYIPR